MPKSLAIQLGLIPREKKRDPTFTTADLKFIGAHITPRDLSAEDRVRYATPIAIRAYSIPVVIDDELDHIQIHSANLPNQRRPDYFKFRTPNGILSADAFVGPIIPCSLDVPESGQAPPSPQDHRPTDQPRTRPGSEKFAPAPTKKRPSIFEIIKLAELPSGAHGAE